MDQGRWRKRRMTRKQRFQIVELKNQGHHTNEIARLLGIRSGIDDRTTTEEAARELPVNVSFSAVRYRLRAIGLENVLPDQTWFSDEEYHNMMLCYKECSGKIYKASCLFEERYGKKIPLESIRTVITAYYQYIDSLKLKDKVSTSSVKLEDPVIKKITDVDTSHEDTSDSNNHDANVDSPDELIIPNIIRPLYVYTTRLDDMKVLKRNFNDMPVKNILSRIIQESMPNLTNGRPSASAGSKATFEQVVNKIDQYNDSVVRISKKTTSALNLTLSENSLRLLKSCKPLSIPLTKISTFRYIIPVNYKNTNAAKKININNNKRVPNKISSVPENFKNNVSTHLIDSSSIDEIPDNACIIIKNSYLNNTEIYNNMSCYYGSIKEHYTIDHIISDQEIFYSIKARNVVEFLNCCWHQNEYNIKNRFNKFFNDLAATWYLRKPHNCTGTCNCCCRHLGFIFTKHRKPRLPHSDDAQLKLSSKTIPVFHNFERNPDPEGYLSKVLCYFPRREPTDAILSQNQMANNFALYWEIETNDHKLEQYSLGPKGINRENIHMNVCCWHKRQRFAAEYPPLLANLMREPHPCTEKCKCCCKIKKSTAKKTLELKIKSVENNYQSKHVPHWRNIEIVCRFHTKNLLFRKSKLTVFSERTNVDPLQKSKLPKPASAPRKLIIINRPNMVLNMPLVINQVPNQSPMANTQFNFPNPNIIKKCEYNDPTITPMIERILSQYGINLTVDARGLVNANLETPLHTMSTESLKELATVLKDAQAQVDAVINKFKNVDNSGPGKPDSNKESLPAAAHVQKDLLDFRYKSFFEAYSFLTQVKANEYRRSFRSHAELLSNPVMPVIESVISLASPASPKPGPSGVKRTAEPKKPNESKRIRIKSPSKINNLIGDTGNENVQVPAVIPPVEIPPVANPEPTPIVANSTGHNQAYYQFVHNAESDGKVPNTVVPTMAPQPATQVPAPKNQYMLVSSLIPPPLTAIVPKKDTDNDCILGM